MLYFALHFLLLLHTYITTAAVAQSPAYTATDSILLNCGAISQLTDNISNRTWDADEGSRYAPPNSATASSISGASSQPSSVNQVPYMTARVFTSDFTYSFPLLTGPKFLRLHFFPSNYSTYDTSRSFFTVMANNFTLLSNFSAFLNSPSRSIPNFFREFLVNIDSNQRLDLNFSPNPNSFAFINGIEIVSMPSALYFTGNDSRIRSVSPTNLVNLPYDTVLENLYRLNVGGRYVGNGDDSSSNGMFRSWSPDDVYINGVGIDLGYPIAVQFNVNYITVTPRYIAPEGVYNSMRTKANESRGLEWRFTVDSGFRYLLRFHFCEFLLEVTAQNQRVFTISIDNQVAEIEADVFSWTNANATPVFRDYITMVSNDGRFGKRNLSVSLIPNMEGHPLFNSSFLNGLEIFKLSNSSRSLAAANPEPGLTPRFPGITPPTSNRNRGSSVIYTAVGSVIGVIAVIAIISFLIFWRRRKIQNSDSTQITKSSWVPLSSGSKSTTRTSGSGVSLPSDLCRHFLLNEMKSATNNFDENLVIGKGGFGNVYKGYIDDGTTPVAIKRLNTKSNQGVREFLTEIDMLSKLRHMHLVPLLGYCDENGEMILVYDYMANGTLREHLYESDNSSLNWKQRLQICIGSAKGLQYLHTSAKDVIIHRDVKTTNILLDEKFVAKVSDFGLSRIGPTGGAQTHVSTVVKGSFGYLDPEYYKRQQLTDKSDVYSFGVVLFEVLCARRAIIPGMAKEQVNLSEWAKYCHRKGNIEDIIDPKLKNEIAPECLSKFVETALMCVRDKGNVRPAMRDVVWSLEFAMQLQEAAEKVDGDVGDVFRSFRPLSSSNVDSNTTDDSGMLSISTDTMSRSKSSGLSTSMSENIKAEHVFSEILNPNGR